ncbi:WG repeat-containing protein [Mucilaginibacter sp. CAU 1740]|uniref:YARHG domain-containing protein n=1 Tax=Mucilaginibacter sp. CAU 1740 TaxID=3140365 RepID=UPI00325AF672
MKTKAITRIILPAIVIALCGFVLIRRQSKENLEKAEIHKFLTDVNKALTKADSSKLQTYLTNKNNRNEVGYLVGLLKGEYRETYTDVIPQLKLHVSVDTAHIDIQLTDSGTVVAIPVTLRSNYTKPATSKFILHLEETPKSSHKIKEIETSLLADDYIAYEDKAYIALEVANGKYQPITKKAFTNATTLKARYDSVIWFSHVKGKTYYYTVKGKWDIKTAFDTQNNLVKKYKMGLVGPDLKEAIPVSFDMIRSINGTFPGLVEVEKDQKHGFYDLNGKLVVPVQYDQIFPVTDKNNKAALRMGRDFYWLKNDYTISAKTDLTMSQVFAMLTPITTLTNQANPTGNITEFNSDFEDADIYIPPSHLIDLDLAYGFTTFKNPLRKEMPVRFSRYNPNSGRTSVIKQTASSPPTNKGNWIKSILYSITEHFVGGRFEFYKSNDLVLIDEKRNQAYGQSLRSDYSYSEAGANFPYYCNDHSARAINDSLVEVKASASTTISLYNKDYLTEISEMPMYHYFVLKNNKMAELQSNRLFSFTQYVKLDDSYLNGCYSYFDQIGQRGKSRRETHLSNDGLLYMKNEIYASYGYKFRDETWNKIFYSMPSPVMPLDIKRRDNIDNLLTATDKYNIQWIDKKLNNADPKMMLASK